MKVEIIGRPEFYFKIDRPTLDWLLHLSKHHYDGKCKSAGEVGGFLYGWSNMVGISDDVENGEEMVHATWHQLDITHKLIEMAGYIEEGKRKDAMSLLWKYMKATGHAMSVANQQEWKVEVEN